MTGEHRPYVSMLPLEPVTSDLCVLVLGMCVPRRLPSILPPPPHLDHLSFLSFLDFPGPHLVCSSDSAWGLVGTAEPQGDTPDLPSQNLDLNQAPEWVPCAQSAGPAT